MDGELFTIRVLGLVVVYVSIVALALVSFAALVALVDAWRTYDPHRSKRHR